MNENVKAICKLRGNRDREELAHCAVLIMPVEEFSHVQYSALPSVEWQQRGRKRGPSFARINALPDDGVTVTPKHVGAVLM